jgi:hypothetical protein
LAFHAADHVEGGFGFTAQRHLQQVFLDAGFDGLAQLGGDLEKAVRRTKTFNALVRPFVVVIADPEADALPGRLEAFELSPGEKLLPDRFPEAFNLAQRHRVMGPGLEVMGAVLFHLGLEAGDAAPVHILPAVVGEHLPGRLILAGGHAKDLQDIFGGVAAEQIRPHNEPRVVIHEADEIGVTAAKPEGEDVGLPHLIGCGPLKEAGTHHVARCFWPSLLHQALRLECFAHRRRAGLQKEHPLEQLRDPLDAAGGFFLLELDDLFTHCFGQLGSGLCMEAVLQALLALVAIALGPFVNRRAADAQLLGDQFLGEALFEVEFDGAETIVKGYGQAFFRRSPPRGGGGVELLLDLLYWFVVLHVTLLYH